jgi:hypothetical protein
MKSRGHREKITRRLLMGLLAAGACFAVPAPPAFSAEGDAPGLTIYIDPQTGAILKEPAPGTVPLQLTPQLQNAFSTTHHGLAEVLMTAPGGGVKVDLQGRFQSPLFATVDANGKIKIHHLREATEPGDRK